MGGVGLGQNGIAQRGIDPFTRRLDERGHITHGHLAEDDDHGGAYFDHRLPTLSQFPEMLQAHSSSISGFMFDPGDFTATGSERCIPTIHQGQQLKFVNDDASPLAARKPARIPPRPT